MAISLILQLHFLHTELEIFKISYFFHAFRPSKLLFQIHHTDVILDLFFPRTFFNLLCNLLFYVHIYITSCFSLSHKHLCNDMFHLIYLFTHLSIYLLIHQIFVNHPQFAMHQDIIVCKTAKQNKTKTMIPTLTELMF